MRSPEVRQFRAAAKLDGAAREAKIRDIALALARTWNLNGIYAAWESHDHGLCNVASAVICQNIPEMDEFLQDGEVAQVMTCIVAKLGLSSSDPAVREEAITALRWIVACGSLSSLARSLYDFVGKICSDDVAPDEFEQILELHSDIENLYLDVT